MTLLYSLSFFSYPISHSSLARLSVKYWNSSYFRSISFPQRHRSSFSSLIFFSVSRMKVLLLLSLIVNVLCAQREENKIKLNPSLISLSSAPSFMPGYPIVDTYWFDMNYGDPSPTCNAMKEYRRMLESGPLCNCYFHEMAVIGSEFIYTILTFIGTTRVSGWWLRSSLKYCDFQFLWGPWGIPCRDGRSSLKYCNFQFSRNSVGGKFTGTL